MPQSLLKCVEYNHKIVVDFAPIDHSPQSLNSGDLNIFISFIVLYIVNQDLEYIMERTYLTLKKFMCSEPTVHFVRTPQSRGMPFTSCRFSVVAAEMHGTAEVR